MFELFKEIKKGVNKFDEFTTNNKFMSNPFNEIVNPFPASTFTVTSSINITFTSISLILPFYKYKNKKIDEYILLINSF